MIICTKSLKSENILLRCRFLQCLVSTSVSRGVSWVLGVWGVVSCSWSGQCWSQRRYVRYDRNTNQDGASPDTSTTSLIMSRSLMGSRRGSFSRDGSPSSLAPGRKISAPAGPPGNVNSYASPSYITLQGLNTRKSAFRKYGCQKAPEADKPMYDPSLLYTRGKDRT